MKRAKGLNPTITEEEPTIDQFIGLNTFGPHADLGKGEFRALTNYDIFGDYIKSRRGSVVLSADVCPDLNILSHVQIDTGAAEYGIIQQDNAGVSEFRFIELSASGVWVTVKNKTGLAAFTLPTSQKADMMVSNGKVYIFCVGGNAILEFDNSTANKFLSRKMGLPAPQITTVVKTTLVGGLRGKRVYGVELVYKNTAVTPDVDIVSSGVNRALKSTGPLLGQGALAYTADTSDAQFQITVSTELNDGSLITASANDNWTHARLWRSKDITTATNSTPDLIDNSEITGRPDELYIVQEMTKAAFTAASYAFAVDAVKDDNMPFPLELVTGDRLEIVPIPKASTGSFHNNRIWASGITELPGPAGQVTANSIQSKIFYSPETDTKYSESMGVLHAIESDPGDGQLMMKLISFEQNLIGIKESKTGYVKNGDPSLGWETLDQLIGISDIELAQFVPGVGICAIVNDQNDFRIFGFDLQWHSTFAGLQISRPIRENIKTFTLADIDFIYINGKLIVSGGAGIMLTLAVEQQKGWSQYTYLLNSKSEAVFTFGSGKRAAVINGGQPLIEIEAEDADGNYIDTDYNVTTGLSTAISTPITTHKFQEMGGRALIEERFLSIMAILDKNIVAQAYVNGKAWPLTPTTFSFLLDPDIYPDIKLRETEYQGYEEFRAIGNYIHYDLVTTAPNTIYSIMLNCLVQRGSIRPGFDPFELLGNAIVVPDWALIIITETGIAPLVYTETGTAPELITE